MSLDKLENYLDVELKKLRLLEDAKEMVTAIKMVKAETREAVAAKDQAIKDKAAVLKETEDAKSALAAMKKSTAAEKESAEAEAKSIVSEAKKEAQQIKAKAVSAAETVDVKIKAAEQTLAGIEDAIKEKTAALDAKDKAMATINKKILAMAGA